MSNGRRLSPAQQASLREEAVRLRLEKKTLRQISADTGLSAPTIISAFNRFKRGGWEAIRSAKRGRPSGNGTGIDCQTLVSRLLGTLPEDINADAKLWTHALVGELISIASGDAPSLRTVQRHLQRAGLLMPDVLSQEKRRSDFAVADLVREAQFEGHTLLAGSVVEWLLPASNSYPQKRVTLLYARDLRGALHWYFPTQTNQQAALTSDLLIDFFSRLTASFDRPIRLLFRSTALERHADLARWLAAHQKKICVEPYLATSGAFDLPNACSTNTSIPATKLSEKISTMRTPMSLTHLQRLEAESIQIMREVVAAADNPVMLYSIGKDSAVMLHLAMKAFYPSVPPFPLLHVDTTWKFRDMYRFREKMVKECGLDLIAYTNPEGLAQGINPFTHGSAIHTDIMKTEALKQALSKYKFDVAFGGARRDEEKSRAKERVFSFRSAAHRWDPKAQRPEIWKHYNARKRADESIRVFPLSNWTELDIWQYIHLEGVPIVPLYYAAERPVVERDGVLIMVDDDRMPLAPGEVPMLKSVRFRTLGCYPLTGAVESTADTLPAIIQEMLLTKTSERQGRVIDHDSAASMEKKKQEGYF